MHSSFARHVRTGAVERARGARRKAALLVPLIAAVIVAYLFRKELFGVDLPIRMATAVALVVLGWTFARNLGRAVLPTLMDRLDAGTAGTVGFLVRLATIGIAAIVALRVAGLQPRTLVAGGALTAVILGLAAQQTLGNLIAGTVLLSARPFRVGDDVRLHAGGLGGQTEGRVSSLGLLYTTLTQAADRIMVPNSIVLSSAIVPLQEPSGVDLRAHLGSEVKPSEVQRMLHESMSVPTRGDPQISLEEFDGDEVVVRVAATPVASDDGPELADQVLAALNRMG